MILERSLKGCSAQSRKALSAADNASITWLSVCSVKVLSTSPVAGLMLRYDTLSSFGLACLRFRNAIQNHRDEYWRLVAKLQM